MKHLVHILLLLALLPGCTSTTSRGTYRNGAWTDDADGDQVRHELRIAGMTIRDTVDTVESAYSERSDTAAGYLLWIGGACFVGAIAAIVAGVAIQGWRMFAGIALALAGCGIACFVVAMTLHYLVWVAVAAVVVGVVGAMYHTRDISLWKWITNRKG